MLVTGKGFALMNLVKWMFTLMLVSLVGCGGTTGGGSDLSVGDYGNIRSLSAMYDLYTQEHKGKTPANEQEFRAFMQTNQDVLEKTGRTIDEVMTSPRSGEPFVMVYGKPPIQSKGMSYIGYENSPVDGKRLVIGLRGMYEELDEAEFKKLFPDAS
jgi:hypothetical protein